MKFEFEFIDKSSDNSIVFDYSEDCDEDFEVCLESGKPVLYANRQAYLTLAKIFIKLALGRYKSGFHVHLCQNFDADRDEAIRFHIID